MGAELRVEAYMKPETFGKGTFLGDNPEISTFLPEDRLRISAWRHACPSVGAVAQEYGIPWTRQRYDECNFVFRSIICEEAKANPQLFYLLVSPTTRRKDEPVGRFETGAVPEAHKLLMSPLSTPWGYALPRVFIEEAGRTGTNRTFERYEHAMQLVTQLTKECSDPIELLAKFSGLVTESNADSVSVLSHILAKGILEEENCKTIYRKITLSLEKYAPYLWKKYQDLSSEEKQREGILDLADI